jgi:hypothetical protein
MSSPSQDGLSRLGEVSLAHDALQDREAPLHVELEEEAIELGWGGYVPSARRILSRENEERLEAGALLP